MNQLDILEELINVQSILDCALKRNQDAIDHLKQTLLEIRREG
jgi:hypothetical protein